jgi:hypothetical protein
MCGQNASATFLRESDGRTGRLRVDVAAKREDSLYIGPCKYAVLKIERSESRYTKTQMIKFDGIYPLNR